MPLIKIVSKSGIHLIDPRGRPLPAKGGHTFHYMVKQISVASKLRRSMKTITFLKLKSIHYARLSEDIQNSELFTRVSTWLDNAVSRYISTIRT